eukprot:scaffold5622_cov73-Isochrysis_galbana.AAC.1
MINSLDSPEGASHGSLPAGRPPRGIGWLEDSWPASDRATAAEAFSPAMSAKAMVLVVLLEQAARNDEK